MYAIHFAFHIDNTMTYNIFTYLSLLLGIRTTAVMIIVFVIGIEALKRAATAAVPRVTPV